jgi:hypothetical protein
VKRKSPTDASISINEKKRPFYKQKSQIKTLQMKIGLIAADGHNFPNLVKGISLPGSTCTGRKKAKKFIVELYHKNLAA